MPAPSLPPSPWRASLAAASRPLLTRLVRLPRLVVPVVLAALLLAGLLLPEPWGALPLLVVVAFLGWLLALSWPQLRPGPRALRLVAVALLLGVAVSRLS